MKKGKKPPPTIWEVPDDLWERIEALLKEMDPPKETGRPRADARLSWLLLLSEGCRA